MVELFCFFLLSCFSCKLLRQSRLGRSLALPGSLRSGVYPFGAAVGPVFLLPDRHELLQPVNDVTARLERLGSVWTADRHRDADIADVEMAEAVFEDDIADRPALPGVRLDLRELL